ncbi:polysaccharide deacetylase family protein [Agriterribacter sp.]|uniref:polysaccharide deacetylase family protein n=1 Tax=Agriterribacter sp. TaxID=2821509 RepID=UPI002CD3A1D3|nr:polysaccharide deacetylase family protein [Agriterribacter sp.]HTN07809.1 polysaccharide deacetylase family protein [Agriterribacter sp.]
MFYFIQPPWWLKKLYPACIWEMETDEKVIYLTFDDGPHLQATPFVLDELKRHDAKATFFCIGKNVARHSDIYRRIVHEGHRTGNHTFHHMNGWKANDTAYLKDIAAAREYIDSGLFRPPYGKITKWQVRHLTDAFKMKVIMWSVLSADFDAKVTPETCLKNVMLGAKPGSIVVFHDSEKAWRNIAYALPKVLMHFSERGYRFEKINL